MRPRQKPRAFFYIFIFVLPLVFLASSLLVTLTVTSFGCHHSFIWQSAFVRLAGCIRSFGCQRQFTLMSFYFCLDVWIVMEFCHVQCCSWQSRSSWLSPYTHCLDTYQLFKRIVKNAVQCSSYLTLWL